jgi:hypothetical protein
MKKSQAPSKTGVSNSSKGDLNMSTPSTSNQTGINSSQQRDLNSIQSPIPILRKSPRLLESGQKDAEVSMEILDSVRKETQTQLFTDVELEVLENLPNDDDLTYVFLS